MTLLVRLLRAAFLVPLVAVPAPGSADQTMCFYLDKSKVQNEFIPLILAGSKKTESLRLDKAGLSKGKSRTCLWALNGGSGTKEQFAFDGDYAVPILDPACESPFSHQETGVGFGDWYLTLCGSVSGHDLIVQSKHGQLSVPLRALTQWTQYEPGRFPIHGDLE